MSHVPHELAEEFPDHVETLHELKAHNAHFVKIADEYHTINREIHRIETGVEPASDERAIELRRKRMALKDEVNTMLNAA
ncbi:MAG: DUF465 domain-containing protein [Sphingomonadaceae bacterium]|nr:DUF465 domain-containing protein [Sphingomonadaceae bacterium]